MARITKRTVDALKPGSIVWDSEVTGFGVRCQRKSKVYILKCSIFGRQRWFTIGKHGSPWTVEKARTKAKSILGHIADGNDPATARDDTKANPTIKELADMFMAEHVKPKRKKSTAVGYQDYLDRLVVPAIGKIRAADVAHKDIAKLHHSLKDAPYQANRVLAVLSKMMAWAEKLGYRSAETNPCRHIEKYKEHKRERFLSEKELSNLAKVLNDENNMKGGGGGDRPLSPHVIAAIRLLIFTGARLGEILNLEWAHVDLERALLLLPDSKTGKKTVFLSAPAMDVLSTIPRIKSNPYVICGNKDKAHLVNLQKPWRRIRKKAGLGDVRLHDLRHSFASIAASGGLSLPMIGKLLGHTQTATTERYAHLASDPLRAANEAIGQRIATVMKGNSADVVELSKQKA